MKLSLLESDYKLSEANRLLNALREYRYYRNINKNLKPTKTAFKFNIVPSLFGSAVSNSVYGREDAMDFLNWWYNFKHLTDFSGYREIRNIESNRP